MKYLGIILFFSSNLFLFSCTDSKHDTKDYINKFYSNKEAFDELIIELRSSKSLINRIGKPIKIYELNDSITKKLNQLGVSDLEISYSKCQGLTYISLTTSWAKKATVYFTKDSCDKIQTAKGYYGKTSEMIEVWGLGDNWLMWIDYDFI